MEIEGGNHIGWGAKIAEKTVQCWGCSYSEAKAQGGMMSSLIGVPLGSPQVPPFVSIVGTGPLRYNSRLPVIVYAPEEGGDGLNPRARLAVVR